MTEFSFETLRHYLHGKLQETIEFLPIGADLAAPEVCWSDVTPYLRSEAQEAFQEALARALAGLREEADDGDAADRSGPSQEHVLEWGDFNPWPHLNRDCAIAGVDCDRFEWVPNAIGSKFSSLVQENPATGLHASLDNAVAWIEAYVADGPRSWVAFELDLPWDGSAGVGHSTSETLEIIADVPEYVGLLLRKQLGTKSRDAGIIELRSHIELMRLVLISGFATPRVVWHDEHWELSGETTDSWNSEERSGSWLKGSAPTSRQLREVSDRWMTWSTRDAFFDAAMEHYLDALFTLEPADTAAHAIMSMEALVAQSIGGKPGDKARDVVARRGPRLVETVTARQARLRDLVNRLYDIARNPKVHGVSLSLRDKRLHKLAKEYGLSAAELAEEMLMIASRSILVFHDRLASDETIQDVYKSLDLKT